MCRINGIINYHHPTDIERILSMRDSMSHGGPDDAGVYVSEKFIFAHRRLSLLDLSSAGHQPMHSKDKNICITFNGEIYNFIEIRNDLIKKGYTFHSKSDTEVIINAYDAWGEQSFSLFNGMFAFALSDKLKNLIYLVRDASGIKPLYYFNKNKLLIFSSEVKSFSHIRHFEENDEWKILFLTFGFIPEPNTTLKDVFMLPRGSFLKCDLQTDSFIISKFHEYSFSSDVKTEKDAVHLVRKKLEEALSRQLIADAPLGIFLSGGIDSSLLALLASNRDHKNLRTLSIVFDEVRYSERKYQEIVVKKLNNKHTYHTINKKDFINSMPDILNAMDQPSIDGINTYFISRSAKREGLKAVLSGLGADELLGGYPSFSRIGKLNFLQHMPSILFSMANLLPGDKLKKLAFLSIPDNLAHYLFMRGMFIPSMVSAILNIEQRKVKEVLEKQYLYESMSALIDGDKISWMETNLYMQNQLLRDSDYMSMWHSVEIRVPFLDKEFIEAVMQIDPSIKFKKNIPKHLLIKAFGDILPKEIWNRPKQGFAFPFQEWLTDINFLESQMQFSNKITKKLFSDFTEGKLHWSRFMSLLLIQQK